MKTKLLAAIFILLSFSAAAAAQTVSIGDASASSGGTVVVPIMINSVTDLGSVQINLIYNKDVVNVISVTNSAFDALVPNINNATGITTIGAIQISNPGFTGDVRLANITLKAMGSEGQSSPLNLTITTLKKVNNDPISAATVNGTFRIKDMTAPASITNLQNTVGNFWINWTWNKPLDSDFNYTMIFIDGTFVTNTSSSFYNATYSPHATRKISTHTVDTSGNVNATWVNQTTTIQNNVPTLSPITDKTTNENQTLFIDVDATDADGDTLTYSTNRSDLFTDFSTTTGKGNWTPSFVQAGVYYVNFGVSDGFGGIANTIVKITVNNVNRAPSISSVTADKTTVAKDETFTVTVAASDPDGDALTYQFDWQNNGTWSPNQSANTASHSYSANGTYPINARVWDIYSASAAISSLVITVHEETTPPTVTNPSANPNEILLEEAGNAQHMTTILNVTVTDASGVASVTINLSSIGGSATAVMNKTGSTDYSITTNATGTPGSKSLGINATDILGNSNTSVNISLKVTRNGDVNEDGAVDIADAMWLAKNRIGISGFPINTLASDVNGDSTIDIADAMYIAKHVIGISGFENLN